MLSNPVFLNNIYSRIYFWLCWGFVAAPRFSLVAASGSYSSHCSGLSCCRARALGVQAQKLWHMGLVAPSCVRFPRAGIEPMSAALAGGYS